MKPGISTTHSRPLVSQSMATGSWMSYFLASDIRLGALSAWLVRRASVLHGFIGTLMGLKTFTLIMVVMNMGFLRNEEIHACVRWLRRLFGMDKAPTTPTAVRPTRETEKA